MRGCWAPRNLVPETPRLPHVRARPGSDGGASVVFRAHFPRTESRPITQPGSPGRAGFVNAVQQHVPGSSTSAIVSWARVQAAGESTSCIQIEPDPMQISHGMRQEPASTFETLPLAAGRNCVEGRHVRGAIARARPIRHTRLGWRVVARVACGRGPHEPDLRSNPAPGRVRESSRSALVSIWMHLDAYPQCLLVLQPLPAPPHRGPTTVSGACGSGSRSRR